MSKMRFLHDDPTAGVTIGDKAITFPYETSNAEEIQLLSAKPDLTSEEVAPPKKKEA